MTVHIFCWQLVAASLLCRILKIKRLKKLIKSPLYISKTKFLFTVSYLRMLRRKHNNRSRDKNTITKSITQTMPRVRKFH